jgi:hypothetical protein
LLRRTYAPPATLLLAAAALAPACKEVVGVEPSDTQVSDAGGADASTLRGCVDEAGRVHLVWSDERLGVSAIFHARSEDGGATWEETQISNSGPASSPDLACVGERVYVVWEDLRDSALDAANIYLDRSADGGATWLSEDVALDGDPLGESVSLSPRVAAAGSGVYVAWTDGRNGAFDIYLQASTDGGEIWPGPVRVDADEPGEAWSGAPQVAADGEGGVAVAWEDLRSGSSAIYAATSSDYGRSFDAEVLLSQSEAFEPALAMTPSGVAAAWHIQSEGGARAIYAAARTSAWGAAEQLSPDGADAWGAALALVEGGAQVAWQDDRDGAYDAFVRADVGEGWGGEVRLDVGDLEGRSQSLEVRLAAWDDGMAVAHWQDRRDDDGVGFNDLFYALSEDGGLTWGEVDLRINGNSRATSYCRDSWVGRVGDKLVFAWLDGRYGNTSIFSNSLAPGEESQWEIPGS